jgi:hypothetical protein
MAFTIYFGIFRMFPAILDISCYILIGVSPTEIQRELPRQIPTSREGARSLDRIDLRNNKKLPGNLAPAAVRTVRSYK